MPTQEHIIERAAAIIDPLAFDGLAWMSARLVNADRATEAQQRRQQAARIKARRVLIAASPTPEEHERGIAASSIPNKGPNISLQKATNVPRTSICAPMAERDAIILTDREKQLVSALRYAWYELNTIKARDGVAYHRHDQMPYCDEGWWRHVTEKCEKAIEATTGEPPLPWPFKWELGVDG